MKEKIETLLKLQAKKSDENIYDIFHNLYQWGREVSTYKLYKFNPKIQENNSFAISQYKIYIISAERMAALQLYKNPDNHIPSKDEITNTWEKGCLKYLPELRNNFIEYNTLYYRLIDFSKNYNNILGILLASDKINAFRNFGWKIASYLRYDEDFYRQKIKIELSKNLKVIWHNINPDIIENNKYIKFD